jgi:hypothetical protein
MKLPKTRNEKLSEVWQVAENNFGFQVPPDIREYYDWDLLKVQDDESLGDLEGYLEMMIRMVKYAYSISSKKNKNKGQRGPYYTSYEKKLHFALNVAKAIIDVGQDPRKGIHWGPVVDKLNAKNAPATADPERTRKEWSYAKSDTAIAGSIHALALRQLERSHSGSVDSSIARQYEDNQTISEKDTVTGLGAKADKEKEAN